MLKVFLNLDLCELGNPNLGPLDMDNEPFQCSRSFQYVNLIITCYFQYIQWRIQRGFRGLA